MVCKSFRVPLKCLPCLPVFASRLTSFVLPVDYIVQDFAAASRVTMCGHGDHDAVSKKHARPIEERYAVPTSVSIPAQWFKIPRIGD